MSTNKQALRNSADRDWFEEWFKKEYHPNKTGPYIKDQMFFAIQAARAPLLDELEAAEKRIAEREAREVVLPKAISVLHRRDFIDAHREIYAYPEAEVNAALAAAGITVKGDSE